MAAERIHDIEGIVLFDDEKSERIRTIIKSITVDTLKAIPNGVGGHISIFPWYDA